MYMILGPFVLRHRLWRRPVLDGADGCVVQRPVALPRRVLPNLGSRGLRLGWGQLTCFLWQQLQARLGPPAAACAYEGEQADNAQHQQRDQRADQDGDERRRPNRRPAEPRPIAGRGRRSQDAAGCAARRGR